LLFPNPQYTGGVGKKQEGKSMSLGKVKVPPANVFAFAAPLLLSKRFCAFSTVLTLLERSLANRRVGGAKAPSAAD
jgi:hypothetical protein